jgi:hypothetical protein
LYPVIGVAVFGAVHERSICVEETAIALKLPGAFGCAALTSDEKDDKIRVNEITDNIRYFLIDNK